MKKITLILLMGTLTASLVNGQGRNPGGGPPPGKGPKGNHSNGNGPHNPPPGQQGNIAPVFSAVGFDVASAVEATQSNSAVAPADAATTPATGGVRERLAPVVIGSSFMTPSGWGSTGTFAFAGVSGTPYQQYASTQRQDADLLGQVGFGVGNAQKFVSFIGIVNVNDLSKFDNFSYSGIVSRQLGKLSSISVGALHLFADPEKTDAGESYYVAYSQAIRRTKFSYTVGYGTGRFYDNNQYDIESGKTEHGTGVFANVSYNIKKNIAVSTEWTGRNIAVSSTIMIKPKLPVLALGVADLTRLSGDHPVFYVSLGQSLVFNRRR